MCHLSMCLTIAHNLVGTLSFIVQRNHYLHYSLTKFNSCHLHRKQFAQVRTQWLLLGLEDGVSTSCECIHCFALGDAKQNYGRRKGIHSLVAEWLFDWRKIAYSSGDCFH